MIFPYKGTVLADRVLDRVPVQRLAVEWRLICAIKQFSGGNMVHTSSNTFWHLCALWNHLQTRCMLL